MDTVVEVNIERFETLDSKLPASVISDSGPCEYSPTLKQLREAHICRDNAESCHRDSRSRSMVNQSLEVVRSKLESTSTCRRSL